MAGRRQLAARFVVGVVRSIHIGDRIPSWESHGVPVDRDRSGRGSACRRVRAPGGVRCRTDVRSVFDAAYLVLAAASVRSFFAVCLRALFAVFSCDFRFLRSAARSSRSPLAVSMVLMCFFSLDLSCFSVRAADPAPAAGGSGVSAWCRRRFRRGRRPVSAWSCEWGVWRSCRSSCGVRGFRRCLGGAGAGRRRCAGRACRGSHGLCPYLVWCRGAARRSGRRRAGSRCGCRPQLRQLDCGVQPALRSGEGELGSRRRVGAGGCGRGMNPFGWRVCGGGALRMAAQHCHGRKRSDQRLALLVTGRQRGLFSAGFGWWRVGSRRHAPSRDVRR